MRSFFLLFICITLLGSCKKVFFREEPANDPEAIFEDLWKNFNENYGPTEERNIDWAALYQVYRPQINAGSDEQTLYQVITGMLSVLNDGHVGLIAPNRDRFNSNYILHHSIGDELFDLKLIKSYLEPGYQTGEEDAYVYGKIQGTDIGYIYFDYIGDNFFVLNDFLDKNLLSKGIIIDLRHNQGGDFTYCFSEIGRLTNQERLVFRSRTKNGPGRNDFTSWYSWHIQPKGSYFDKPIVILTDRYTISAGERSVMAFKTLPNVTIMGDTTCGAHSTMIGRELANGWYYTFATQNTLMYDDISYEGKGITPDVRVVNSSFEMLNGIDRTLQEAIASF